MIKTRNTEAQLSKITLNSTPSPLKTQEYTMKPSEMASSSNSRWQNRKERPN